MTDPTAAAYSEKTRRALGRYTPAGCLRAYKLNAIAGEGPATIATAHSIPNVRTVRAADAAINAGRAMTDLLAFKVREQGLNIPLARVLDVAIRHAEKRARQEMEAAADYLDDQSGQEPA